MDGTKQMMLMKQTVTMVQIINAIIANYRMITPVELSKFFGLFDGGKLMRRHLRNNFSQNHYHNQKWQWVMSDETSMTEFKTVVEYFYNRFAVNADMIPTKPAKTKTTDK